MTAQPATPAKKDRSLKPCSCSRFEVGEFDPEKDGADFTTDCNRQTNRLFAQGHDAKLVSFLVRGELDGYEIRTVQGGVSVAFPGAVAAAASVSEALASKAANMLRLARERAEARAKREADKATRKVNKVEPQLRPLTEAEQASVIEQILGGKPMGEPAKVKAKVGRWPVEGTVDGEGRLHYTTKSGEAKTADAGKWGPQG